LDPTLAFQLLVVAEGREPIFSDKHLDPAAATRKFLLVLGRQVRLLSVGPTDADLDRVFMDLNSGAFKTREKAARELAEFGESAVPAVRERLERPLPAEVRQRAAAFLDRFDPAELWPLRAVELVEGIGTPAAIELLVELAKGPAGAPLTWDAAAALGRLSR